MIIYKNPRLECSLPRRVKLGVRLGIREKTFFVILPFSTKQGLNIVRSFGVIRLVLFNNSNIIFKNHPENYHLRYYT